MRSAARGLAQHRTVRLATPLAVVAAFYLATTGCKKSGKLHASDGETKTADEMVIKPDSATVETGGTLSLGAFTQFATGSLHDVTNTADWRAATDCTALTVSNADGSKGLITGIKSGTCAVEASNAELTASASISVVDATTIDPSGGDALQPLSLTLSPLDTSIPAGFTQEFQAQATYEDGTTQDVTASVTWASQSEGSVLRFDQIQLGLAAAISEGSDVITARATNGVEAEISVAVTAAVLREINIVPPLEAFFAGLAPDLRAIGVFSDGSTRDVTDQVTWESSDTTVLQFDDPDHTARASLERAGLVEITATIDGINGSLPITIGNSVITTLRSSPQAASVPAGFSLPLTLDATLSDGQTLDVTSAANWESSDISVGTVSNNTGSKGLFEAVSLGACTITGTFGDLEAPSTVDVTGATLVALNLVPDTLSLPSGMSEQLSAIGIFSDGTFADLSKSVVWASSSSETAVVAIDFATAGRVSGLAGGTATISAALGGLTAQVPVEVREVVLTSIEVTPASAQVPAGFTQGLRATAHYSDNTTADVTNMVAWRALDGAVAVVASGVQADLTAGTVSARTAGTTTIEAALDGLFGSAGITVTQAVVASVALSPSPLNLPLGASQRMTANGSFSDGTVLDITSAAVWTSSDSTVATIDNMSPNRGLIKAKASGSTTIRATIPLAGAGAPEATQVITVTSATVKAVTVLPSPAQIGTTGSLEFTATATLTDNTTMDITHLADWLSTAPNVATVSSDGVLQGVAVGTTKVSATYQSIVSNKVNANVFASAPPQDPSGITANADSAAAVTISWTSGGGTTSGYTLSYRVGATAPSSCTTGTVVSPVAIGSATTFQITNLSPATTYSFRVCAVNVDMVASSGVTATVTTLQDVPPDPTDLQIQYLSSTDLRLTWTSGGESTSGYIIAYQEDVVPEDCETGTIINAATIGANLAYTITPLAATQTYGLRVCAVNNNATPDLSDGVTTTATMPTPGGDVTVTQPNTAVSWLIGSVHAITWSTVNVAGNVTIKFSSDGGATFPVTLAANIANSGTYDWTVNQPATTQARIRVEAVADGSVTDQSDTDFTIPVATLTVTRPNGGEVGFMQGVPNTCTWTSTNLAGDIEIHVDYGSGQYATLVATASAADGTVACTFYGTTGTVRIWSKTLNSIVDLGDGTFVVVH